MKLRSPFAKASKKKHRTRSFVVTTDKNGITNVFPYSTLQLAEIVKSDVNAVIDPSLSKEEKEKIEKATDQRTDQGAATTAEKLAKKPFDPSLFYWMADNSIYFQSCVEQTASDIAGTGWDVVLKEDSAEDNAGLEKILALLDEPNDEYSIDELWQNFLIDYNQIGYSGIEVVRDIKGDVKQLWHMNANSLWRHKDKTSGLFAEKSKLWSQKEKWFVLFGKTDANDKLLQVHKDTGKVEDTEFKNRAHEIIYAKRYYWRSSYYGAPPIAPASGEVVMGIGARDYNIAFFLNYGVPAMLVMLSGEWEDDVDEDEEALVEIIKRQLKDLKGPENNHGTIVIQTPEGCVMTVEKLAVETKEGSFRLQKADIAQDVLVAYRMPPYRIGLPVAGALAGDVADEMLRTYKTARVEPGQLMLERHMDRLFRLGLGVENYRLKLNDMVLWDEKAQAEISSLELKSGLKTPNQIRRERGLSEYIGGDTFYIDGTLLDIGEDDTE